MIGLQILTLVLIALSASLAAIVTWLLVPKPPRSGISGAAEAPRPVQPQLSSAAEIATLKHDIAALIDGQAERDSRLLMEIRATALTKDPAVIDTLQRIETALGIATQDRPQDKAGEEGSKTDPTEDPPPDLVTNLDPPADPDAAPAKVAEDAEPAAPVRNIRMG